MTPRSLSSDIYRNYSAGIVRAMAERYCGNAALAGWQVDNEVPDTFE